MSPAQRWALRDSVARMRLAVARHTFATLHVPCDNHAFWRGVNIELTEASDALVALEKEIA